MSRFRSKSFRIMTLVLVLVMSLLINLPAIIEHFSNKAPARIGYFPDRFFHIATKLQDFASTVPEPGFELVTLPDQGSAAANEAYALKQLESKQIKGYLSFRDNSASGFPDVQYKSNTSISPSLNQTLQTALNAIKTDQLIENAGLTAEQKAKLKEPVRIESLQVSASGQAGGGKTEAQMRMAYALVYVLLFLLYIGVIAFGNMVATEVTAEKSSRVMEVLITSVAPLKQMFGKIIGICLLGLAQIAVFVAVIAVNLSLPHNMAFIRQLNVSWSDLQLSLLGYFFIYYLAGFFIYATIFAAIGSLVSRTEEVGQAIMPVTYLIIAAFMIAMYGLNNPTAPFVVAMSFVPFFSPLIMFLRIGMTSPALWEIGLSIAELALSIFALGWIAAKVYRTGVLLYGKRPSFRELRKAMRAFKVG
jgi:ABC-2 type transport system permease protein